MEAENAKQNVNPDEIIIPLNNKEEEKTNLMDDPVFAGNSIRCLTNDFRG